MKNKYNIFTVVLIAFLIILIMPNDNSLNSINIVGSTSVQPICEQLVEEYKKTHDNVDINVQGGGTSLGIKCANLSVADIGMSSKEIECENLNEYQLGYEGIVIVVNENNPVNDLSTKEIRDIFSGKINNWNEISDKSGEINVIVREEGSGTLDAFKDEIMKNQTIKKDAVVQNSPGSVRQSVIQDENAIGFVSLAHSDSSLKNLSIDGVFASRDSIIDGSYKLKRPFVLLTDKNPNNQTKDFLNWALGNGSHSILESEKIIRGS
jgi:phosphate transport system substrate-binding protein